MEIPVRAKNQFIIEVSGSVVSLIMLGKLLKESQVDIKLKEVPDLGDKVLVINLNNDTFYRTEMGRNPNLYKKFNYPQNFLQILEELYYESKRRFQETNREIYKSW